jgi:hypothetical protein
MVGKLELKLWPVGEGNRYIEIKNPEYLLQDFPSGEVPTKIISYGNETPDSLKEVQRQTTNRLAPILYPSKGKKVLGDGVQLALTAIPDGAVLGISFSSSPLVGAVGMSAFIGMTAVSAAIGNNRNKYFNKKAKKIQTNLEIFKNTPTDKIEVVQDEELKDIANAIENNKPLNKIKPDSEDSYSSIRNMFYSKFGTSFFGGRSLTSRTREVYRQKIDAHKEIITRA